jgi:hypothetical protein
VIFANRAIGSLRSLNAELHGKVRIVACQVNGACGAMFVDNHTITFEDDQGTAPIKRELKRCTLVEKQEETGKVLLNIATESDYYWKSGYLVELTEITGEGWLNGKRGQVRSAEEDGSIMNLVVAIDTNLPLDVNVDNWKVTNGTIKKLWNQETLVHVSIVKVYSLTLFFSEIS